MRSASSRALLSLALAGLALSAAFTAAPAAAIPARPACTVTLDSSHQTANITAVLGAILKFSGQVTVTTGTTNPRSLAIEAVIDPSEWAAQVNPTSENVSDGEVVPFNATVAVPPAALASVHAQLTIDASFEAVPGSGILVQCSAVANIDVVQYRRVDIDTTKTRVSFNVGPVGTEASVIVHNLGNGKDSFTLRLEEPEYLMASKISTSLPGYVRDLPADGETTFTFTINATSDAKAGSYDVAVVLTSDADSSVRDNLVFTAIVNETIIDQLIPSDLTSFAILGAVVAALVGMVALRRRAKRKRAARDLQALLRQRRAAEQEAAAAEGWPDDGAVEGPHDAGPPPESEPAPAPVERVRVKVKAPPKA